ncbi:hypothetical protein CK203_053761 [Vitis vinifera]|uniref:Uncharacterized protein n=1 Tax=Vitis vinifera TaxID=29760 RepID=A0A438GQP9_VITVI|nr:hypothetical protein CK203_053761 [Vitis vinifera]
MPCAICLSYEHLVDECPTIPFEREMFGDCNTYNSNWRDHPNFSWKPQPPQYQQPAQAPQQASSLEQAMVNLSKVVGDFVRKQEAINAQINQRIDRVESTLNKRMDEMQNDLSQKLDILQDSISRLANLNIVQEKENSPSQPCQNSMSIHDMEAKEGKPSQKKEVKEVITLRSGFWMIKIKRNCKEIEGSLSEQNRSQTERKQGKNRGLRNFAASAKSALYCKTILQPQAPLCENFRSCETNFGTRVPLRSTGASVSQLRNALRRGKA